MSQHEKKVSFGFSKIIKKPELNIKAGVGNKNKIDYIKCVDDKSIKVIGEDEEKKDKLLIIPMLGSKSWHDRIVNKINANSHEDIKDKKIEVINNKNIKVLKQNSSQFAEKLTNMQESKNNSSLDEQAALEIVQDLENERVERKNENLVIDKVSDLPLESQESTLENYEEIPIEEFGIAMLRGMGWNPDKGIGKNAQIIKSVLPTLRPKGIGLGADKIFQRSSGNSTINDIKLKLEKGSYVKIVAGNLCNNYGIIESFDDNSGRIIIKLATTDKIVSLNEILVQPITKTLYEKNSRVINSFMYEKYKNDLTNETAKNEEPPLNQSERIVGNHVKNNKISMTRQNHREPSSSNYDDDSGKDTSEKSSKRIQLKKNKKSYDSKRHCKSSGSHRKVEKKNKKEKKRHKDEKYKLCKHKQSRSRTN